MFRRFHEAWTSGDLPTVLDLVDPAIVARPLQRALFTRSEFRGTDGIVDWYHEMTDPWDRFEARVEDARPTPTGTVGLLTVVGPLLCRTLAGAALPGRSAGTALRAVSALSRYRLGQCRSLRLG